MFKNKGIRASCDVMKNEKKGLLTKIYGGIKKYKKEIFIGVVTSGVISLIPYYYHISNLYRERIGILDKRTEILNKQIKFLEVNKAETLEPNNILLGDTRKLVLGAYESMNKNEKKYQELIEKSNKMVKLNELLGADLETINDFSITAQIKLLKDSPDYELVFFKPGFLSEDNFNNYLKPSEEKIKDIKKRIILGEPWGVYGDVNGDGMKDIIIHGCLKKTEIPSDVYDQTKVIFREVSYVRYALPNGNFGPMENFPPEFYKSFWEEKIFKEPGVLLD